MGEDYRKNLKSIGHIPLSPLQVITRLCLRCRSGNQAQVIGCEERACVGWPWRLGANPWKNPPTPEQTEARRERMAHARKFRHARDIFEEAWLADQAKKKNL